MGGGHAFQGLGLLDEADLVPATFAQAVSADGTTAVGRAFATVFVAAPGQAFRWTADTGLVLLPSANDNNRGGEVTDVSGDGSVIVGATEPLFANNPPERQAFRWSPDTGLVGLNVLRGDFESRANGVSNDGSVVVGHSVGDQGTTQAFGWTEAGGMAGLGFLPGAPPNNPTALSESDALDVSGDGSKVVGWSTSSGGTQAFQWTQDTGMVGLGFLPNDPGTIPFSQATAISDDGSVVVGTASSSDGQRAFRWTQETGMVALDNMDRVVSITVEDVSADGSVIVGTVADGFLGSERPFIWDQEHGMRDLERVLRFDLGMEQLPWMQLTEATGVSADGLTIVGNGFNLDFNLEGWIVTIPEPASAVVWLAGMGLATLLPARKRS